MKPALSQFYNKIRHTSPATHGSCCWKTFSLGMNWSKIPSEFTLRKIMIRPIDNIKLKKSRGLPTVNWLAICQTKKGENQKPLKKKNSRRRKSVQTATNSRCIHFEQRSIGLTHSTEIWKYNIKCVICRIFNNFVCKQTDNLPSDIAVTNGPFGSSGFQQFFHFRR